MNRRWRVLGILAASCGAIAVSACGDDSNGHGGPADTAGDAGPG